MPDATDIAWLDVVESDALTMSRACAGRPLRRSRPKSRSMTSATAACAVSSERRSSSNDDTVPRTSKYWLASILATSSRDS
jgi:hypothetical protein